MERWVGQLAVVTGASAGIGAAIAKKLVESGVNVVGMARRVERMQELSKELKGQRATLYPLKCDLNKEDEILKAFAWIKTKIGPISILVNNAGITKLTTLIDGETADWREIFEVNCIALCVCTREALKSMKEAKIDGHIIHINSITGHQIVSLPEPILNVYPATKHAVTALAEILRNDLRLAGRNVKITSVSPGLVATEFQSNLPETIAEGMKQLPILESVDIAEAVNYVLGTPPHVQICEMIIRPVGEMY